MPRHALRIFLAASISALLVAAFSGPASAESSGPESFHGFLLASGTSGERQVLLSPVVATGVFNGIGRIVEVDSLPTDPPNVLRDDLVFRTGTAHLVSTSGEPSFSLDPETCKFTASVEQTNTISGGTGVFANASGDFTGLVHAF